MSKRKARSVYEVLVKKGGSKAKKNSPSSLVKKLGGVKKDKEENVSSFGDRKINFSLSLNALTGLVILQILLLAGMYGLGRIHGGQKNNIVLAKNGPIKIPSPTKAKAKELFNKTSDVKRDTFYRGKRIKALCIISYKFNEKGKRKALQMVEWLKKKGFKEAKCAARKDKNWMVVIPIGKEGKEALKKRIYSLEKPAFAEKGFRFSKQKLFTVNIRVIKKR